MKATGATQGVIGIEVNKPDAIERVEEVIKEHKELSSGLKGQVSPRSGETAD